MQDIGKHFVLGISSTKLNAQEKKLIKQIKPLGYIFFDRNFSKSSNWIEEFNNLISELKEATNKKKIIFSIDHEGGRVNRLPAPINSFPYAKNFRDDIEYVAKTMAKDLSSIGINLNYSPVLDIDLEDKNTVISKRSFSSKAQEVAKYGTKFAKVLEDNNVISCAKHFPGHGATIKDSHFELPLNNKTYEEILAEELIPFKSYIENGFKLIMTSHILFPKLDSEVPATLSKKIINNILREDLKYKGCIITDDLDMKALDSYEDKELKALEAGVDILLICGPDSLAKADKIKDNIAKSKIDLSKSSKRIDNLINRI